jgi:hypothetical protein
LGHKNKKGAFLLYLGKRAGNPRLRQAFSVSGKFKKKAFKGAYARFL